MTDSPTSSRQPSRREDAVAVIRRLREAGYTAYLAGGCVRDELLGLEPKDFDVATDATPQRVRELFPRTQAVGAAFGVILVHRGSSVIEVATFRAEGEYTDGRRPDAVTFTTAEADAARRDFTINGLFLDPIDNRVIDFVGGQEDLKLRRLRAIGEAQQRFGEDYLRLLRAVRFAARFQMTIEPATEQAIVQYAPRLAQISPERICEELRLMLTPPSRLRALDLLARLGLLAVLLRQINSTPAAWPVFASLAPGTGVSFPLALAALGFDACAGHEPRLSRENAARIIKGFRRTLRLSNDQTDALDWILRAGEFLPPNPRPTVARMKRYLAGEHAPDSRRLLAAVAAADDALRGDILWLEHRFSELDQTEIAPPPLLTGDDLIAQGLQPGPRFKRMLELTYDEQLEGRLSTREEAMRFALGVP